MKTLVQINVTCNGSTGRIMNQIQEEAIKQGWKAYSFFGRGNASNDNCIKIDNKLEILFHVFLTRVFGKHGHGSFFATKRLVRKLKKINPDIIHLHNIHGYYLNLKVLFRYLQNCNKKIIWTLHDCWAFTGHCSHFTVAKCNKWENECLNCPQKKSYPKSIFFDTSKKEYLLKKELFTSIKNLTIVTPSNWLKELVQKSFFKNYEIDVINNGIDLSVFKPTNTIDVKSKYNIPKDKKIILGVAAIWDDKKGLNEFLELSKIIKEDTIIVLIGLNDKQIASLSKNIIGIKRTENVEELANLYTISNLLFNPSKEETFSLVTAEAISCGTKVIAYNNSAINELVDENLGISIDVDEKLEKVVEYFNKVCNENKDEIKIVNKFDYNYMVKNYLNLYEK